MPERRYGTLDCMALLADVSVLQADAFNFCSG